MLELLWLMEYLKMEEVVGGIVVLRIYESVDGLTVFGKWQL